MRDTITKLSMQNAEQKELNQKKLQQLHDDLETERNQCQELEDNFTRKMQQSQKRRTELENKHEICQEKIQKLKQNIAHIPEHFVCPISLEIMEDPVIASDGYTYERKSIEDWFSNNSTSPKTNLEVEDKKLITNHNLRSQILEFRASGLMESDTMGLTPVMEPDSMS